MQESCITNRSLGSSTQLDELVAELSARVERGEAIDLAVLTADCPQYREQLEMLLPTLEAVVRLERGLSDRTESLAATPVEGCCEDVDPSVCEPMPGQLGDFCILRELGRGGMGIVYEAEQISLGRRVALKVLPFAAMLDKQQLARFKNEARTVATLDHPNIVAIHSVGVDRGVHYYAMQLIAGQSLAQVIDELRLQAAPESAAVLPGLQRSTLPEFASREYFATVARLGIQAAEALGHAHLSGVLHRDIKPANLLVDEAGKLWITDFGLARMEQDTGMTMPGDLIGTLRYMPPETALSKEVVNDCRADVYSLGATLFELLTLRPAFDESNRSELLRQIGSDEPPQLRKIDNRIPADLETIVHKAMAKDPNERYPTAKLLAEDLNAFLSNRPISAKPASVWQRTARWSRRHQLAMMTTGAALAVAKFELAVGTLLVSRERRAAGIATKQSADRLSLARNALRLFQEHKDQLAHAARLADRGYHELALRFATDGCQKLRELLQAVTGSEIGVTSELLKAVQVACETLFEAGFKQESAEFIREMVRFRAAYVDRSPDPVYELTRQGFTLTTWPQVECRDADAARRCIERALEMSKGEESYPTAAAAWWQWGVLAFVHLRFEEWESAIELMEKSIAMGLRSGRPASGMDWHMYSLAHWHLGNRQEAVTWYERGSALIDSEDYIKSSPGTDRGSFYERNFRKEVESQLALVDLKVRGAHRPGKLKPD